MKTMIDASGNAVPVKYVSTYDKKKDKIVKAIHVKFAKLRESMEKLVVDTIKDIALLKEDLPRDIGVKGNFSATSFDGKVKIELRQQYNIKLDERVAKARNLMLEYAEGLLKKLSNNDGSEKALRSIIMNAFEANSAGILPYTKILALLRLDIHDSRWLEARELLVDSIKPEKGKCYLYCSYRPNIQKEYQPILLNLADCWPNTDIEV